MSIRSIIGMSGVLFALPMTAIQAAEIARRFSLELEPSLAWQGRNDVQIPNNDSGTRFSIADTVGSGPVGLASPQGRAFDFSAKVGYQLNPDWTLTAGLRMLDGGADNNTVYNFARFSYGTASAIYRF